jgi:DNA-binding NarL/FixJ family response regulator
MNETGIKKIRILLIDDHALFCQGVARLLESEPDFAIVGCCLSIEEGLKTITGNRVDVVLLDYDLGNQRGSEFLSKAVECEFSGHTLILTAGVNMLEAKRLVSLGASGIFLKHDPPNMLAKCIREVAEGRSWLPQAWLKELVQGTTKPGKRALTDRESDVLRLVFDGFSNKEIGAKLSLSEGAIKTTLQQLFNKTGVRTRSQLTRVALEQFHDNF